MQAITNSFEPIHTTDQTLAILCTLIAVASIVGLILYNRKPPKSKIQNPQDTKTYRPNKFKPLASLGLFFIFLISISTAFFSWLTTQKITTVTINKEYIETPYGKVDWDNIQSINIDEDKKIAPFTGRKVGKATKILVIIEVGGKTHALSEVNYDVKEMGKTIAAIRKNLIDSKSSK